ncbi:MAG: HAMP domain-containing protein [bacterium]
MEKRKRRTSYIVKQNFQLRYISIMVFLILAATILVGVNIYYQMGRLVMENTHVIGIASFLKSVNITMAIWISFIILLVVFFGIFLSHRIAGPIKNLENNMQRVGKGDLTKQVRIRKNDEFRELVDVFNSMVKELRQSIISEQANAKYILNIISRCKSRLSRGSLSKQEIDDMKEDLETLNSLVNGLSGEFKV